MKAFIIMENGDDYHGTRAVCIYLDREKADKEADNLQKTQEACAECGHLYSYSVLPIPIKD